MFGLSRASPAPRTIGGHDAQDLRRSSNKGRTVNGGEAPLHTTSPLRSPVSTSGKKSCIALTVLKLLRPMWSSCQGPAAGVDEKLVVIHCRRSDRLGLSRNAQPIPTDNRTSRCNAEKESAFCKATRNANCQDCNARLLVCNSLSKNSLRFFRWKLFDNKTPLGPSRGRAADFILSLSISARRDKPRSWRSNFYPSSLRRFTFKSPTCGGGPAIATSH
jgi:hypothetical protein